jgi:hypothetical protein
VFLISGYQLLAILQKKQYAYAMEEPGIELTRRCQSHHF